MSTNNVPSRDNWDFSSSKYPILKDKKKLINSYILYMLARTQNIFEYDGLPNTVPQRELELMLQCHRFAIFNKVNGEYYVMFGGLGGIPNEYYLPTKAIVNNPYLKYNATLDIKQYEDGSNGNKDCVVVWNDSSHIGLMPMYEKYSSLLAECDISLRLACVNTRILALVSADNDTTKESAEKYFEDVDEGIKLGVIATNGFFEGLKTQDYANKGTSNIKDLMELKQYLIGSWYNDIGLQSNFNMKRESINSTESGMNEDALLPLIDDMLESRKRGLAKINELFGLNITVKLSSAWRKVREEIVETTQESQVVGQNNGKEETTPND